MRVPRIYAMEFLGNLRNKLKQSQQELTIAERNLTVEPYAPYPR